MRAPLFMASWLVAFAVAASVASLGGALLLDRELRRERAGAAARGEMDAFLESKLAGRWAPGEGLGMAQGLAGPAPAHGEAIGAVAAYRAANAAPSNRVFLFRHGERVTGTAAAWPAELHPMGRDLVRYVAGGREVAAATHVFPGGDRLLIGRVVEAADPLSPGVLRLSGVTILGLALAGGAVAWLFAVQYGRRLRAITDALEQVEAGRMDARAPGAERGDEFGALARRVNRTLDRVGRYVRGVQEVSDEIAHDLRTPLNRLQLRLASVRPAVAEGARREFDLAAADARGLSKVIDDFLWLREVEAGQGGEPGFVELRALCDQLAEDHGALAEDRKAIALTVEGPAAEVVGVPSLLLRALDNLIGNAVKFTPEGGAVQVRIEPRAGDVAVLVEDTGPGMPPELLARATQPGVRGETAEPGHGLGLAIAAAVARRHGGDLTLETRSPNGLRAALILPTAA